MKFSGKMDLLGTESAFEVLARAKALEAEGHDIVHLEIGEPDFDTPANIIEKAKWALDHKYTHYTPSAGLMEMRDLYAGVVSERSGIELSGENIVIMPGAKPVIFLSALALIEEGDEVIYPNPGYPIYASVASFLGAKTVPMILREENDFRFDADELRALVNDKTKLMFVNTPMNPTGGILTKEDLYTVAELAEEHDFYVLSDEVYSRIIYEGEHFSMLQVPDALKRVILLDGHSKTYAMTGWRLGYAVCNKEMASKLTQLMTNANSCPAAFTQIAGGEALTGDQSAVGEYLEEYRARRDLLVGGLNEIDGVSCLLPKGAFYVFPNVQSFGKPSREIADFLMEHAGVSCLSGTSFGEYGKGYIRFSYATSRENISKALNRIQKAFCELKEGKAPSS